MSNVPSVSGPRAIEAFCQVGFEVVRITGSHRILKKPGHQATLSVPVHGNQALKTGTLRGLIRNSGLSVEQFVALL